METIFTGVGIGILIAIFILYVIPLVGSFIFTTILWINNRGELKGNGWVIGVAYFVSFLPTFNIFEFFTLWYLYNVSKK